MGGGRLSGADRREIEAEPRRADAVGGGKADEPGAVADLVTYIVARDGFGSPVDRQIIRQDIAPYIERLYREWERGLLDAARLRNEALGRKDNI